MEEGIVPGGTESLLYSLIFPKHASPDKRVKVNTNTSKLVEAMEDIDEAKSSLESESSARTVAQIKHESKAKQLARLEAASLSSKKKLGNTEEFNSAGVDVGGDGDVEQTMKHVPFAKYRACTESTRERQSQKGYATLCHPVKNPSPKIDAVGIRLRGKVQDPSHEEKCKEKHLSRAASMASFPYGQSLSATKTEAELVYRLNEDSPRGEVREADHFAGGLESRINLWPGCLFDSHCHLNLVLR